MKLEARKYPDGVLRIEKVDEIEQLNRIKTGDYVTIEVKRPRNHRFHRKLFSLFRLAYDYWHPVIREDKWSPQKNFERFWKDLVILAGYSDVWYRLDNSIRVEAKSISFGLMDEDEFADLYNRVLDVIFERIAIADTKEEIDEMVNAFQEYQ